MNSIAVMGAGGVGGHYGAVLAHAGKPVSFIARGAHLEAMRRSGLTVEREGEPTISLPRVAATDRPADIGPVDLVLFTPKAFDLEEAAEQVKPLLAGGGIVLPLLNGLDIADRVGAIVGHERVLAGICQISSAIVAPGHIRQTGPLNRIAFGEPGGGTSPRVAAVAEMLKSAGIRADPSERMVVEVWRKFFFLDPLASACALTASPLGKVREDPDTRAVLVACLEEVRALADAEGVPLPTTEQAMAVLDGLPAGTTPSLLRALELGARLELDILQGAVLRLGRRLGVPTPVHELVHAALKLRAGGRAA
jgi:2-dehydropantoate 2-reductase